MKINIQHKRDELLVYYTGNDEYVVNFFSDVPDHLYIMLLVIENVVHDCIPSNNCPSFEEIKSLVGNFKMYDGFDLFKDNIYQKLQERIFELSESDKRICFKNYIYAIALNNPNWTREPTFDDILERIKHTKPHKYQYYLMLKDKYNL